VKPDWWIDANSCADEGFLETLFKDILEFNREFQERLKKNQFAAGSTKAGVQD